MLTDNGLLTAYARSSMKPGSKLTGSTAMLAYSNFELSTGKNMYTVVDATSMNRFPGIYADTSRYSLATYFCELLKDLAPVEEDSSEYVKLLQNCLYLLDKDLKPLWQIKSVFELSIMTLSGYMPDVFECSSCGERQNSETRNNGKRHSSNILSCLG